MKISLCMYRKNSDDPEKLGVQIESEYPKYVLSMEGDIIHPRIVQPLGMLFALDTQSPCFPLLDAEGHREAALGWINNGQH